MTALAASVRAAIRSGEQVVLSAECDRTDRAFRRVRVDVEAAVIEGAARAFQRVRQRAWVLGRKSKSRSSFLRTPKNSASSSNARDSAATPPSPSL